MATAMMLRPDQVVGLWEQIKYVAQVTNRNNVGNKLGEFLNRLLADLLSGTAQCSVRYDDENMIEAMAITRTMYDRMRDEKSLFIVSLFSFKKVSNEVWGENLNLLKSFARSIGCKQITTYSNSPRIFELAESVGFKENYRSFSISVGGN